MYTKSIIYKIYSIAMFVLSILSFLGSVCVSIISLVTGTILGVGMSFWICLLLIIISSVSLLFSYVEFSSMFSFAKMIEYVTSESTKPMKKPACALPQKFYGGFGTVMFLACFAISVIAGIILIVSYSIQKSAFLAIPIIPVLIMTVYNIYVFIHYFVRYRAIGDMLRVTTGEDTALLKQNIKELKTSYLRGYCVFLFIVCILTAIGGVVTMILTFPTLTDAFGIFGAIISMVGELVSIAISILCMSVFGCYVDNIAKMVEGYQIKFGFWNGKKEE